MKFKRNIMWFVLVLFVSLLFFCIAQNEALPIEQTDKEIKIKDIKGKIDVEPCVVDPDRRKEEVAEKVFDGYEKLSTLFSEAFSEGKVNQEKIKEMAKLLGNKASIKFNDEIFEGKKEIEKFFARERLNHNEVEFGLKWALITCEKENKWLAMDYINRSHETFEFKFNPNGEGEGSNRRRHREDCEWFIF